MLSPVGLLPSIRRPRRASLIVFSRNHRLHSPSLSNNRPPSHLEHHAIHLYPVYLSVYPPCSILRARSNFRSNEEWRRDNRQGED